jgi:rare lipoprotein A (peptidoglycan hydrolase)
VLIAVLCTVYSVCAPQLAGADEGGVAPSEPSQAQIAPTDFAPPADPAPAPAPAEEPPAPPAAPAVEPAATDAATPPADQPPAPPAPAAPAVRAPSPPSTGGATFPLLLPAATGGIGYGDSGTQSLAVSPIAVLHRRVVARGTMPGQARNVVILQRLDATGGWRNVARARIHSTDRFEVNWRADRTGRIRLRAIVAGRSRRARASAAPPIAKLTVYRPAMATFYGPGFFGQQTACGQTLTADMPGVAHKQLPCGTLVAVTYAGREIVVPVIDRGPFHEGFSWDLTQATADALGFAGAGEIGYTRVSGPAAS